jgi:uncharacterized protein YccT (UPF0319 family)
MKFGPVVVGQIVVGLLSACLIAPSIATTLKLAPELDLLVVDGKKMSGSLLKGADSLELDGGQHQILFKIAKTVRSGSRDQVMYTSAPLIVAFDTKNIALVAFKLPRLDTDRDGAKFDKNMDYQLVDQTGKALPMRSDTLHMAGLSVGANFEKAMAEYNGTNNKAAVPAFASIVPTPTAGVPPMMVMSAAGKPVAQKTVTLQGENISEQMLQYWFQQADKDTQKRFLEWAGKNTSH